MAPNHQCVFIGVWIVSSWWISHWREHSHLKMKKSSSFQPNASAWVSFKISTPIKLFLSVPKKKKHTAQWLGLPAKVRFANSTKRIPSFMCTSCSMSIAFWSVYVSALHDHNYRLPKLIISSRLMCWRLFVMCAVYFVVLFCGQRVLRSCALPKRAIRYRF